MDLRSETESELISLISQFVLLDSDADSEAISLLAQIIYVVRSIDIDSQPKSESDFMSLTTQIISLVDPTELDSLPKPLPELISFLTQLYDLDEDLFLETLAKTLKLEPVAELMALIHQMLSLVTSMQAKRLKFISLSPQVKVISSEEEKFCVKKKVSSSSNDKWDCIPFNWEKISSTGTDFTYFLCKGCNGGNHQEFEHAPVEIKHHLHPKHSLQLVVRKLSGGTRTCYCCDDGLIKVMYYCAACDFAMNIACVQKQPLLSVDHPKWHEHKLALFPSQASFTCNLCALKHSRCPFYICPPCDFVVHKNCISLPHVIRISRHPHRICFTHSLDQGEWSCGVCRRKIDNDYGGYSCTKGGCSYAAHARCATQRNVWDGKELEKEPEEIEEVVEPFLAISNGVIQHFSHEHHLRLDVNTGRDYDENKMCQACITPIYFGNFYYCLQCDGFILHEKCANLPRKIYTPIHPHMLNLVGGNDRVTKDPYFCVACFWFGTAGFSYGCSIEGCRFELHVQCATISEPLVSGSHMHPLFLTSKPGDGRKCTGCKTATNLSRRETFNCIEECDFALCYRCASLPEKVRYKHDKHMLTLSYEEDTKNMAYWCEVCEWKINPNYWFYKCDEYCCVTLHISCLIGIDLYFNPRSSIFLDSKRLDVLSNKMCRPFCSNCKKRCPYKMVLKVSESVYCSYQCSGMKDT